MSTSNYREIPALLQARVPFEGNTMSATLSPSGIYEVYSYATVIATVADGQVHVSDKYYSKTTSRHQNLCRENL